MTLYSHSRISTYENCPYKFKLRYIDKVKTDKETIEAFLGSRVHETLEWLYEQVKMENLPSLKKVLRHYEKDWKRNFNNQIRIVKDFSEKNYYKKGRKFIINYYKRYKPFKENTIETEKRIVVNLDGKGRYKLQGYIDRLVYNKDKKEYEIHDYKTNNYLKTQDDLDQDRQLALYSIAINESYPDANKICLVWHFLAFDKEFCSYRDGEEIEKLKKDTIEIIKEIETHEKSGKEWKPKKSNLCKWCEYRELCPEFKHLTKFEDKSIQEFKENQGVKFVDEYSEIKNELSKLKKKEEELKNNLIQFSKKKKVNTIYGSDFKVRVNKYKKVIYPDDKQELINLLKKKDNWKELESINYPRFQSKVSKGEIDKSILKRIDFEDGFRVSLSKRRES